jgi:UDP-3-O-[3-hydroxymyristoyl] glucosamine N-acyltransferase
MVLAGSVVGDRVRLGPSAVVGSEGFGFLPAGREPEGKLNEPHRIPQIGHVVIESDVDIGAMAVVDRATIGKIIVKRGSKLDNLVHVGHNAVVGEAVIIAAQTGLAGSVSVGDGALLGGQVGIADHLVIGEEAKVAAKSGVVSDVPRGATYAGYPAVPHSQWLRAWGTVLRRWTSTTRRRR